MSSFSLRIVEPSGAIFAAEVESVTARTTSGEITILKKHIPLVSTLEVAVMAVKTHDESKRFGVYGGFVEVRENGDVVVLADEAERPENIDETQAKDKKAKAQQAMNENEKGSKPFKDAAKDVKRQNVRLKLVE